MLADQEIRHWRPAKGTSKWNADTWTPAYPSIADGAHTLAINADDVGRYDTREACQIACDERNAGQLAKAEAEVDRLADELHEARGYLATLRAALSPKAERTE